MKPIILFACMVLASTGSAASDFSKLSEPAFARTMLLGPRRAMEAQCGALALADARLGRSMKAAEAQAIAAEIMKPLLVEIGSAHDAGFLVDGERFGPRDYDDADAAKQRIAVMDMIEKHCAPLFDAFRTGGAAALQAKLLPQRGLIPLVPLAECVAVAEASVRTGEQSPYNKESLAELSAMAREGGSAQTIADRERAIEAARVRLAANPEEADALMMRAVACLATFREHAQLLDGARHN